MKAGDAEKFKEVLAQSGICADHVMPHGSYLINLGSADETVYQKSLDAIIDEVRRCHMLGVKKYNFHPGSAVNTTVEEAIERIANSINIIHKEVPDVVIVLENMAGQGNVIGSKLEELAAIIAGVQDKSRVGVCVDTAHAQGAGLDVSNPEAWEKFLDDFDKIVGAEYLCGMHLNDSKAELGSRRDLHQSIGRGRIGIECFRYIMNSPRFSNIPLILETPMVSESIYKEEIDLLYSLQRTKPGDPCELPVSSKHVTNAPAVRVSKTKTVKKVVKKTSKASDVDSDDYSTSDEDDAFNAGKKRPRATRVMRKKVETKTEVTVISTPISVVGVESSKSMQITNLATADDAVSTQGSSDSDYLDLT